MRVAKTASASNHRPSFSLALVPMSAAGLRRACAPLGARSVFLPRRKGVSASCQSFFLRFSVSTSCRKSRCWMCNSESSPAQRSLEAGAGSGGLSQAPAVASHSHRARPEVLRPGLPVCAHCQANSSSRQPHPITAGRIFLLYASRSPNESHVISEGRSENSVCTSLAELRYLVQSLLRFVLFFQTAIRACQQRAWARKEA